MDRIDIPDMASAVDFGHKATNKTKQTKEMAAQFNEIILNAS